MSRYRISTEAQADLEEIWWYIAEENEQAADLLIDEIIERFPRLAQFPKMGRKRAEILKGLRSFPVQRYTIFYRLVDEGIEVIRVLHSARDIEKLFLDNQD